MAKAGKQLSVQQQKENAQERRARTRSRREVKERSGMGKAYDMFLPRALRSHERLLRLQAEAQRVVEQRAANRDAVVPRLSEMVH